MNRVQDTKQRIKNPGPREQPKDSAKVVRRIVKTIEDGLVESLGSELALAVRVCLSTPVALSDPLAYASALEVMVGNEKAELALDSLTRRLRDLGSDLQPAHWVDFTQSILALRSRYSPQLLHDSK